MNRRKSATLEPESAQPWPAGGDPPEPPLAASGETGKVLVIDDAPSINQLLQVGLSSAGFEVISALDGSAGLAQFIEHRPDVAVVDVLMPGMDGYELCRRLRD